jgi:hypothetical protein
MRGCNEKKMAVRKSLHCDRDIRHLLRVNNFVLCSHKRMPDLPIEILHEIFTYLSSTLRVDLARFFPWYLGQVCSRWRVLFFSMRSTFWRKIEIEWKFRYNDNPRFVKTILAFFLNRTQGAPFSISLFRREYDYPEKKDMRWILKDLLDHSRQWEEVFIRLKSTDVNLLRSAKGHLPLLKRLEIIVPSYYVGRGMIHPSFTGIFGDAPLLTHVVVEDISTWEFNWPLLTTFGIGRQNEITNGRPLIWWSSPSETGFLSTTWMLD